MKKGICLLTSLLLFLSGLASAEPKCEESRVKQDRPPKIQLRAILVRCPYRSRLNTYKETGEQADVSMSRSREVLQFYGYDSDEPLLHSEVIRCRRKLVITVKLSNCGKLRTDSEYVVIDHVYDPVSKQKARLLNPVVIKITQQSILQAYPLNVEHIVNAEATEEIINKENTPHYKGCDTKSPNPTCGRAYYSGRAIPMSEGFCCSCDLYENVKRQPIVYKADPPGTDIAFSTHSGMFPQPLSTHPNHTAQKFKRFADRELHRLLVDFDRLGAEERSKGFLDFVERQNTSYVDLDRLKRNYPKLPDDYYRYPPMEPARGFRRKDFKNLHGSDPWEAAPPIQHYWKEYYEMMLTTKNPYLHILMNRGTHGNTTNTSKEETQDIIILEDKDKARNEAREYPGSENILSNYKGAESNFNSSQFDINTTLVSESNPSILTPREVVDLTDIVEKEKHLSTPTEFHETINENSTQKSNQKLKSQSTLAQGSGTEAEGNRCRRQLTASGTQRRGGQDCIDRTTPSFADPITYHESAHCLRFSELWYTVYKLKEPFIAHTVDFEIFEKHCLESIRNKWEVITQGFKAELGTFVRRVVNRGTTVVFSYTPFTPLDRSHFCLQTPKVLLLVPRALPQEKLDEYPQPSEPAGKYLIVSPSDLTYDGDDCDRAGVSYSAFFSQPDRCSHTKGTCLKNQPLQMWKYDTARKARGEPGKYFLENYVSVPDQAIKVVDDKEFLTLHYEGQYESVVEVELKADTNGILKKESTVQISEMYVDSTCEFHTKVTIIVTNTGLVSSLFRPRMSNCPVSIPTVWYQQEGPLVAIAPQRKHMYRLSLYGHIPASRFHCSVEVLNRERKVMAVRRIRIQKYDRCVCMWHCLCACTGGLRGLQCQPMSIEHYHAAGFTGSMPVITSQLSEEDRSYIIFTTLGKVLPTAFLIHVFLLLFGLCKAIMGLCCSRTIGLLHLHLVCPSLVHHLETLDPLLTSRDAGFSEFEKFRCLRFLEFMYNAVCFLVVPGWCFLFFVVRVLRCCLMCSSCVVKRSRHAKKPYKLNRTRKENTIK